MDFIWCLEWLASGAKYTKACLCSQFGRDLEKFPTSFLREFSIILKATRQSKSLASDSFYWAIFRSTWGNGEAIINNFDLRTTQVTSRVPWLKNSLYIWSYIPVGSRVGDLSSWTPPFHSQDQPINFLHCISDIFHEILVYQYLIIFLSAPFLF